MLKVGDLVLNTYRHLGIIIKELGNRNKPKDTYNRIVQVYYFPRKGSFMVGNSATTMIKSITRSEYVISLKKVD